MKKKFYVRIERVVYYEIVVEAETSEDAAKMVLDDRKLIPADPTDYDVDADLTVWNDDDREGKNNLFEYEPLFDVNFSL